MAILTGFPPSNTISPTIHISDKDLASPAPWQEPVRVFWPVRETLEDKNFWLWRRKIRRSDKVRVTSRVIKSDVKPDKCKQPRFRGMNKNTHGENVVGVLFDRGRLPATEAVEDALAGGSAVSVDTGVGRGGNGSRGGRGRHEQRVRDTVF